jgi:hypothetical protein
MLHPVPYQRSKLTFFHIDRAVLMVVFNVLFSFGAPGTDQVELFYHTGKKNFERSQQSRPIDLVDCM